MWKKCGEGQTGSDCSDNTVSYSWQRALQQAQTVNSSGFAGHMDWRVPNIKELNSIIEKQCTDPAINSIVFPNTPNIVFWSSTPYIGDASLAWVVNFSCGDGNILGHKVLQRGVRLVRGGQ